MLTNRCAGETGSGETMVGWTRMISRVSLAHLRESHPPPTAQIPTSNMVTQHSLSLQLIAGAKWFR